MIAEIASRPEQHTKRELWRDHNDLKPTRPLIFCDPENGWHEIIPASSLQCEGLLARDWEFRLRKEIFWGDQMGDDRVIEPFFDVAHVHTDSGWGMKEEKLGGDHGGAYTWDPPMKSFDQMKDLHFPHIEIDHAATEQLLATARKVLGDLLTVRLRTKWWWTLGMTWTLVNLRGMEQIMLDMYDSPADLKALMAFLRDGHLAKLKQLEDDGLLASNTDDYVGSGGFGYTRQIDSTDQVDPSHMWGFAESQETVGISPQMFAEFVLPYQLPILERFALNCYGCCEPVHGRWELLKAIPNLRRVSVSPWADLRKMAEGLQDRFVFSCKPPPTDLSNPTMNEEAIRHRLRETLAITRGCHLELVMKDNHTLGGNPTHPIRWCQLAREEVDRAYAGSS